jgi:RNA polymerase sigma-70 factor (ECF subfamily)
VPDPILHRIAAGDSGAVQECVDRYGALVQSLARRFCANAHEAEDAVQEVFIDLWRKASRYDPRLSAEITFVTMIARRRLIDHSRRRKEVAASALVDDELPGKLSAAEHERVDLCDEADQAAKALARLRPEEQRVLKLAIYEGLSHEQIANATELPLGTVKTHVRRGLIRVRELLGATRPAGAGGAKP